MRGGGREAADREAADREAANREAANGEFAEGGVFEAAFVEERDVGFVMASRVNENAVSRSVRESRGSVGTPTLAYPEETPCHFAPLLWP